MSDTVSVVVKNSKFYKAECMSLLALLPPSRYFAVFESQVLLEYYTQESSICLNVIQQKIKIVVVVEKFTD